MPLRLIGPAVDAAREYGSSAQEIEVGDLLDSGLLPVILEALKKTGVSVRVRAAAPTLWRLGLLGGGRLNGADIAVDRTVRGNCVRFVLTTTPLPMTKVEAGPPLRRRATHGSRIAYLRVRVRRDPVLAALHANAALTRSLIRDSRRAIDGSWTLLRQDCR